MSIHSKILLMAYAIMIPFSITPANAVQPAPTAIVQEQKIETAHIVVFVNGIVCSFCSKGVRRNLSKLDFIDQSQFKKGVKVEIEIQKLTIAIKPGMSADLAAMAKAIKSGGYEPVKAILKDGSTHMFKGA